MGIEANFKNTLLALLAISAVFVGGAVFMAKAEAPEAPANFEVVATSSCAFEVRWNYGDASRVTFKAERNGIRDDSLCVDNRGQGEFYFIDSNNDYEENHWASEDGGTPIDPEKTYSYKLGAYNRNAGEESWTEQKSATTLPLPSKPGKPLDLRTEVKDNGNIELTWELKIEAVSDLDLDLFSSYGGFVIEHATSFDGGNYYGDFSKLERIQPWKNEKGRYFYESSPDKDLSHKYRIYTQEVGGLGCDFNRPEHTVLSDASEVIIPARPSNFNAEFHKADGGDRRIELTWDDNSGNEDGFEIERSLSENFSSKTQYRVGANVTSYEDTSISAGTETYYYRIRAYKGETYSFYSRPINITTGVLTPQNLEARVSYVNASTEMASTTLTWEENFTDGSVIHIEESVDEGEFSEIASLSLEQRIQGAVYSTSTPLGHIHTYRIYLESAEGAHSGYSNQSSVNLNIAYVLKGVAWSAVGRNSIPVGVGWIKFNSAPENGSTESSVPYSVQVDSEGLMSGLAWAGPNYGWLSFSKEDLKGCPSGPCEARVDIDSGEVSGWAKFVSVPEGADWDGWLKLRGNTYGVIFNSDTGEFSGAAWGGGTIVGWVAFGSPECSDCTVRAEAVVNTCQFQNLSATAKSSSEIDLAWINSENDCVDGLTLYRKRNGDNSFEEVATFPGGAYLSKLGPRSYRDDGLSRDTTYTYYLEENSSLKKRSDDASATTFKAKYSLTCQARSDNEINIFWTGDKLSEYYIKLFGGEDGSSFSELYSTGSGDGSYTHLGLKPDTEYGYEIRIYDSGRNRDRFLEPSDQPVYCKTAAVSDDMPTNLSVIPLGPQKLHVTWKDNAVEPHNFRIERIKLTPDVPTDLTSNVGGGNIQLSWKNTTNANGKTFKGPFYHVIERVEGPPPQPQGSWEEEPSFVSVIEKGSTSYSDEVTDFTFVDNEVNGGPTYFYRVKACSYIKADVDGDGVDESDCSGYSGITRGRISLSGENERMVWYKKDWLGAIIKAVKSLFSPIKEEGESMLSEARTAFAAGIDVDEYFRQFSENLSFGTNPGVYDDEGLVADSAYLYRVTAVFDSGEESAPSFAGAGKTLPPGNETPATINICTRNSFCEPVEGTETDGGTRNLQNQCTTHADCRDVGSSRHFFEETR